MNEAHIHVPDGWLDVLAESTHTHGLHTPVEWMDDCTGTGRAAANYHGELICSGQRHARSQTNGPSIKDPPPPTPPPAALHS